ncbi:HEPN domain-containing protein [Spirulina sp. CS-785/01]|uniref:HEPN domain-containing protein n=1 Tax=Spirulina sp. CS-785/01 TaxID=3021716 RepID=UPI002330E65D|nr:HEPN domain-containing protein [Spirulina sp. CS-785/01]MDB9311961.1 HEPN domain-containing protein [Spirulina sp. CS-785/01]
MTEDQLQLLLKAQQSLNAAQVLLNNGFPDYAAARAYYTMFYIAEAFLEGESMSFSRHSTVISAFGRDFANTRRIPVEFHRFLIEAQNLRNTGDYGALNAVTPEEATEQINRAIQFLNLAEEQIGRFR